ncbi:hypothetical protein UlMin_018982 [Ulmus minor]
MKQLRSLKYLKRIPELPRNLINFSLSGTRVEELPASFGFLGKLEWLELTCKCLKSLPTTICELKSLQRLYLNGCSSLEQIPELPKYISYLYLGGGHLHLHECSTLKFPDCFDCLSSLEVLHLSAKFVDEIPASIKQLSKLRSLYISNWKNLRSIPELPYICFLDAQGCTSLESVSSSRHALVKPFNQSQKVSYFNCLKLDQNACNNIIADYYDARICYPGSEIPEWFADHETTGSSINIKLPGNWCSSKCLGFSICFVAECNEYTYASREFRCEFHLRAKYGESLKLETSLWKTIGNGVGGTQILNSDHVFLCLKYSFEWALACKEAEEITEMSFHI